MATTTVAAILDEMAANYASYIEELGQAGEKWEMKPAAGEGEDAWCARQVAEHIAGAATFFGAGIAAGIGVEGPARAPAQLATVEDALAATEKNHGALVEVVNKIRDDQLDTEVNAPQLGGMVSLERVLTIIPAHLLDHAAQLRTLRTG